MVLNICRLCLTKKKDPLNNIISSTLKCADLTLIDCLYWVFGVEVNVCDPFSKLICSQCICIIKYVGNYRETFQRNQTILQEKRDLFEKHRISEANSSLPFNDVDTSPEKNLDTSVEKRNTNYVTLSSCQLEMVSQPILIVPRLEESNIYREYKKIDDTLYKKIENIDEVNKRKRSTRRENSTDPVNNNLIMVPINKYRHSSPSLIIPRLEDTKFREEFDKVNGTTYKPIPKKTEFNSDLTKHKKSKQLNFINYYYKIRTSALQELIKGRSENINDQKILRRPKTVNDKNEPLLKIDCVNYVYVCNYCSEAFETKQMINNHYKEKHTQPGTNNMIRGRKCRRKKLNWTRLKSKSLTKNKTERLITNQTSNQPLKISVKNKRLIPRMLLNGKGHKWFNTNKLLNCNQDKREHFPSCVNESREKDVCGKPDKKMKNATQDKILLSTRDTEQEVKNVSQSAGVEIILDSVELKEKVIHKRQTESCGELKTKINVLENVNCNQNKQEHFPTLHFVKESRENDAVCKKPTEKMKNITQDKILLSTKEQEVTNISQPDEVELIFDSVELMNEILLSTEDTEQEVKNVSQPAGVEIILDSVELKGNVIHKKQTESCGELKRKINVLENVNCNQNKQEHFPTLHCVNESKENDAVCEKSTEKMKNITQNKILLSTKEQEVTNISQPDEVELIFDSVELMNEILLSTRDTEQDIKNVSQPAGVEIILDSVELKEKVIHKKQTESCGELKRKINVLENVSCNQNKQEHFPTSHCVNKCRENDAVCEKPTEKVKNITQNKILLSTKEQEVTNISQPDEVELIFDSVELMNEILLLTRDTEQEIKNVSEPAGVEIILDSVELKEKVIHKKQTESCGELKRKINVLENVNCNQNKQEYFPTLHCVNESRENDAVCEKSTEKMKNITQNKILLSTEEQEITNISQPDEVELIFNSVELTNEILLSTRDTEQEIKNISQPAGVEIILDSVGLKEKVIHKKQTESCGELKRKINVLENVNCNQNKQEHFPTSHCVNKCRENDAACEKPTEKMKNITQDKILLSTKEQEVTNISQPDEVELIFDSVELMNEILLSTRDTEQEIKNVSQPAGVEIILDSVELKEKVIHKKQTESCGELKRKINVLENVNCNQNKQEHFPTSHCVNESRENDAVCEKPIEKMENITQDKILLSTKEQEVTNISQPDEAELIFDSVELMNEILLSTRVTEKEIKNVSQPAGVEIILDSVKLKEKVIHKKQTESCGELKRKINVLENINCNQNKQEHFPTSHCVNECRENDAVCEKPTEKMKNITQDKILLSTKEQEVINISQPDEMELIFDNVELMNEISLLTRDIEQEIKNVSQPAGVEIILDTVEFKEKVIHKKQTVSCGELKRKINTLENVNCNQNKQEHFLTLHCVNKSRENDAVCEKPIEKMENITQDKILLSTKEQAAINVSQPDGVELIFDSVELMDKILLSTRDTEQEVKNVFHPAGVEITLDSVELKEKVIHKRQTGSCGGMKRKINALENVNCNQNKQGHFPTLHCVNESKENDAVCEKPTEKMENITQDKILLSTKEQAAINVSQPDVELVDNVIHKRQTEHCRDLNRKMNILGKIVLRNKAPNLSQQCEKKKNERCSGSTNLISNGLCDYNLGHSVESSRIINENSTGDNRKININDEDRLFLQINKDQFNAGKRLNNDVNYVDSTHLENENRNTFRKESEHNVERFKMRLKRRRLVTQICQRNLIEPIENRLRETSTMQPFKDVSSSLENNLGTKKRNLNCVTLTRDKLERVSQPIINIPRLEESNIYREYKKIGDTTYKKIENISKGNNKKRFTDIRTLTNPMGKQSNIIGTSIYSVNSNLGIGPIDKYKHFLSASVIIPRLENTKFREEFDKINDTTYKRIPKKFKHIPDNMKYENKRLNFIEDHNFNLQTATLEQLMKKRCEIVKNLFKNNDVKDGHMYDQALETKQMFNKTEHYRELKKTINISKNIIHDRDKGQHFPTLHCVKERREDDAVCGKPDQEIENTTQNEILSTGDKEQEVKNIPQQAGVEIISDSVEIKEDVIPKRQTKQHRGLKRKMNILKNINCGQDKHEHFSISHSVKKSMESDVVCGKPDQKIENIAQDKILLFTGEKEQEIKNVPQPTEVKIISDNVELKEKDAHKRQTKQHKGLKRKLNILENIHCDQYKREHFPILYCVKRSRESDVCGKPDQKIGNTSQDKILLSTGGMEKDIKPVPQPTGVEIISDNAEVKEKVIHKIQTEHNREPKTLHCVKESRENDVVCSKPDQKMENTAQDKTLLSTGDKEKDVNNVPQPTEDKIISHNVEVKEKVMHKTQTEHDRELKRKIGKLENINGDQDKHEHFPTLGSVKDEENYGVCSKPHEKIGNTTQNTMLLSTGDNEQEADVEIILSTVECKEKVIQKRQTKPYGELRRKFSLLKNVVLQNRQRNPSQQCEKEENPDPTNLISDQGHTIENNKIVNGNSCWNNKISTNAEDRLLELNKEQFDPLIRLNDDLSYVDNTNLENENRDIFEQHEQSGHYLKMKLKHRSLLTEICERNQVELQENGDLFENSARKTSASLPPNDVGTSLESNVGTSIRKGNTNCIKLARNQLETASQPISKGKSKKQFTAIRTLTKLVGKQPNNIETSTNPKSFGMDSIDKYEHLSVSLIIPRLEDTNFREEFDKIDDTTYKQIPRKKHSPDLIKHEAKLFHFMDDHNYSLPTLEELLREGSDYIKNLKISKRSKTVDDKSKRLFKIDCVSRVHVCKYCSEAFITKKMINNHYKEKHKQPIKHETNIIRSRKCRKKKGYKKPRRKLNITKSLTTNETKQLVTDLTTELTTLKISERSKCLLPNNVQPNLFLNEIRQNWFSTFTGDQNKRDNFSLKYEHFPNLMFVKENKEDNLVYRKIVEEKKSTMQDEILLISDKQLDFKNVPEQNRVKITLDSVELKEKVILERQTEHHGVLKGKINILENILINNAPNLLEQCQEEKSEICYDLGNSTSDDPCIHNQEHDVDNTFKNTRDSAD